MSLLCCLDAKMLPHRSQMEHLFCWSFLPERTSCLKSPYIVLQPHTPGRTCVLTTHGWGRQHTHTQTLTMPHTLPSDSFIGHSDVFSTNTDSCFSLMLKLKYLPECQTAETGCFCVFYEGPDRPARYKPRFWGMYSSGQQLTRPTFGSYWQCYCHCSYSTKKQTHGNQPEVSRKQGGSRNSISVVSLHVFHPSRSQLGAEQQKTGEKTVECFKPAGCNSPEVRRCDRRRLASRLKGFTKKDRTSFWKLAQNVLIWVHERLTEVPGTDSHQIHAGIWTKPRGRWPTQSGSDKLNEVKLVLQTVYFTFTPVRKYKHFLPCVMLKHEAMFSVCFSLFTGFHCAVPAAVFYTLIFHWFKVGSKKKRLSKGCRTIKHALRDHWLYERSHFHFIPHLLYD